MGCEQYGFDSVCTFHKLLGLALNPHAALDALIQEETQVLHSSRQWVWEFI